MMNKNVIIGKLKNTIKNPYLILFIVCALSPVLVKSDQEKSVITHFFYIIIICLILILAYNIYSHRRTKDGIVLFVLFIFITAMVIYLSELLNSNLAVLSLLSLILLGYLAIIWHRSGILDEKHIFILLTIAAFILRAAYVYNTGIYYRQHDLGRYEHDASHAGYVRYIYENKSLPDFDVRNKWQFYQPPLNYTFEAVWLKIQTLFGMDIKKAVMNAQVLPLFYSMVTTVASYKIFKELNFKKNILALIYAIVAFHPILIMLAGSWNNDMLSIMFMVLSMLFTLRWIKDRRFKHIIPLAFFVGLGMLSKLSAVYVAPAIAAVFLVYLFEKKGFFTYFKQYVVFGIISIPIGMFWSVRNYIKFKVPLNYVPRLGEDYEQYIGKYSLFDRLINSWTSFLESPYFARGVKYGFAFNEFNIFAVIAKSSMFGEWKIGDFSGKGLIIPYILLALNIILIVVSLVGMVYFLIKKIKERDLTIKLFLYVLYLGIIVTYVNFCFTHPHDCTMDFRYIVPSFIIGSIFIGFMLEEFKNKYFQKAIKLIIPLFCVFSTVVYLVEVLK
ncbi:glycosyltransferase family 39 protein [Eubacteriales bacterium OttesenSCG-928-G02]|nr:glycosyltransferase family 39 protein [Eubacteriales bacterium OttesenSCG-928-G02]